MEHEWEDEWKECMEHEWEDEWKECMEHEWEDEWKECMECIECMEHLPHDFNVAGAVERVVHTPLSHVDNHLLDSIAVVTRIDAVGSAHLDRNIAGG
jgi:hypothetical protein